MKSPKMSVKLNIEKLRKLTVSEATNAAGGIQAFPMSA